MQRALVQRRGQFLAIDVEQDVHHSSFSLFDI